MIVNRPKNLQEIQHYKTLANLPFSPDFSVLPKILNFDITVLDGLKPITSDIAKLCPSGIPLQPSQEVINYYRKQQIKFQMIFVIANCYDFRCVDGIIRGKPYSISLMPASKRGKLQEQDIDFFKNFSLEKILEEEWVYINFDPFQGKWDFFGSFSTFFNAQNKIDVYPDSIGFVIGVYFLANKYNKRDILLPDIVTADARTRRKYCNYRIKRYYSLFKNLKPRKLWGADSPIELFLIQALANEKFFPKIQTSIFKDGSIYANFYDMIRAYDVKEEHHLVTSADLYFEQEKLAIFCDSKQYHSSDQAQEKDEKIEAKLGSLGITSLRIQGTDIVHDLPKCVQRIKQMLPQ